MLTSDLSKNEFKPFFLRYLQLIPDELDLLENFKTSSNSIVDFF